MSNIPIQVVRNDAGNCVNFVGTSNPAYWNACLSASVNLEDSNRIDIINDIRSHEAGENVYEFYAVEYTQFADEDGNGFASAQDAADYITAKANVAQTQGSFALSSTDTMSFSLDDTTTSIILSNGDSFGVNTIQAVNTGDGLITIKRIGDNGRVLFSGLDHTNAQVNGVAVAGGLNDVINTLNELFTVGPFEAVVISDPYATMVADVSGVDSAGSIVGSAINPASADIGQGSVSGYNAGGWLSTDTIDQAGEYFSFDIRTEGIIGMGLVHTDAANVNGNATYGDPAGFCAGSPNSGHYGFQFSHWFHPTPNGPWTNYGANTSYSMRSGWSGFPRSPEGADWLAGNPVKMRVGIDENSFISIDFYDVSESTWVPCSRTTYPSVAGVSYKLGIKFGDTNVKLFSLPKVHLLDPVAPTLYYRYIESPDNNFYYPLFASEAEANHVSPDGQSHTHTFADDPTNTTWYMPTGGTHNGTSAPTDQNYTEITSYTNADLAPSQFTSTDYTYQEGTVVNLQLYPMGATFSQTVDVTPTGSGLVYNTATGYLQGTLADVAADTLYTVTVTRANSYGSTVGTFEIQATNVAPVQTYDTPWTKALDFNGSSEHAKQVNNTMYTQALQMNGLASTLDLGTRSQGSTSDVSTSRPWAVAFVFKSDGYSGNQMIWNQGEGSTSGSDNIFVNVTATGDVNFGWGREGTGYNQCRIATGISSSEWYGVAIAHSGVRLSGNNASAANLADCFDIRLMSSADAFASISSNLSVSANWFSTGYRMDRTVAGDFTLGGRTSGYSYSYRGKIASMVVTPLIGGPNYTSAQLPMGYMPDADQMKMMITDPMKWVDDYKIRLSSGNPNGLFRKPAERYPTQPFTLGVNGGYQATQIWLMGDGASDSYANGIRNYIYPADQNYTKLQLNSMVSNDIETVNINGLT